MRTSLEKPNLRLIEKHLREICHPRDCLQDPVTLRNVQRYIEEEFSSYGYRTEKQSFKFQETTLENVIATQGESKERFLIGAHFDGVPGTQAADDNASGVAGLLEIARIVANTEIATKIEFVAFNAEEYGMVGSQNYIRAMRSGSASRPSGMISLEMIGFTSDEKGSQTIPVFLKPFYPDVGNFIALVGDPGSTTLLKEAKSAFQKIKGLPVEALTVPMKGHILPETRLSDHSPFWDEGIPALLVTDTSMFRNPHYHTPLDTIETLNMDFIHKVTSAVIEFVQTL